ncbi:MAG TPA: ABC transporter permease, partial [Chitinophagaceae bacterium]
ITGLATGIAVCMMIFIIIAFHSSFDNFHSKRANIYRALTEYHHGDGVFTGKAVPFGFPRAMKSAFPQIREIAPFFGVSNQQIVVLNNQNQAENKFKEETGVFYTTPGFFRIFDFPLLAGSYQSLKDPNTVLLSKEIAVKYFGDWKDAVGRTIKINNTDVAKVTGVLATIPPNTDFQIRLAVAYGTGFTSQLANSTDYDGTNGDFGCYLVLPGNLEAATFDKQLRAYSKKIKEPDDKDQVTIQALKDIHFDAKTGNFSRQHISDKMIGILWMISGFILLIACVNFINLSTALAVNRAKEVGVRKVLGSNKWQLRLQFLAETFLIVISSIFLSVLIGWLALPYVGRILGLTLSVNASNAVSIALFQVIVCITVTLLAGFYPSLVLSTFNPISALKSKLIARSTKGVSLRKGLVVFQFVIAQTLIIGTLIIVKQMNFFTSQPLGFDKNAIVNVPLPSDSASNSRLSYLKQQLQTIKGVSEVSFNSNTPIEDNDDNWTMPVFDHAEKQVDFWSIIKTADNNFTNVYTLPLRAGRNLQPSDTMREFLVNELFMHNLHITDPNEILGKDLSFGNKKGPIVGILKDFNTRSFRDSLASLIVTTTRRDYNQASIKLLTKDVRPVMSSIEELWNNAYPDFVFEYKFLDDKIENFYKQEDQLSYLYKIFACIAILLSCLGLYGLASFMAVQRIKEVGIR